MARRSKERIIGDPATYVVANWKIKDIKRSRLKLSRCFFFQFQMDWGLKNFTLNYKHNGIRHCSNCNNANATLWWWKNERKNWQYSSMQMRPLTQHLAIEISFFSFFISHSCERKKGGTEAWRGRTAHKWLGLVHLSSCNMRKSIESCKSHIKTSTSTLIFGANGWNIR